jgi:TolB-like protein/Tfp pilus assembly protein PilF
MPLTSGQRVGTYEIVCSLGTGGMGEVYRARDSKLGRDVALKILPPDVTKEAGRLERFDREARAIAALNHPHIVTIFSTEEADGVRFITMELVEGHTLTDLVISTGMAVTRFLDIAIPLADALAAAHQKQITHRDLKPGNVMVSNDGRVKVLDFGLARVGGSEHGEQTLIETLAPITQQGAIVGTMPYMSPEQVEGRPIDARSDLFSLGVIFYELLSGQRPFKGASSPALMSAILRDTPPPITEIRTDMPDAVERLISRLIEKRPEDRVQTARDVFNELKHVRKQLDSGSTRSSGTARSPRPEAAANTRVSVSVRAFVARGADDESKALAEALSDDIRSGLGKFGNLRVLAAAQDARYVVEGQVRRSGGLIRVSCSLIDTQTSEHLWAEQIDRDLASGVFALQDDITGRIVATIGDPAGVLTRSIAAAAADRPYEQLSVLELIARYHAYTERFRADEHLRLRDAFEAALEREAMPAEAWAALSLLYWQEHTSKYNPRPDAPARQRLAAERAVEIDPHNQQAWLAMASSQRYARDHAAVRAAVDRAIRVNPLNADGLAHGGLHLAGAGDYDRALELTRRAIELKPHHPGWYHLATWCAHFAKGDYAEALREAKQISNSQIPLGAVGAAAAAGFLNRPTDARPPIDALRADAPALLDPKAAREAWSMRLLDETLLNQIEEGFRHALQMVESTGALSSISAARPPSSASGARQVITIAVKPFTARSAEPLSALAEGITEDLSTNLGRFGYLRISARVEAARFVVEGSLRSVGSQVRVTARLLDTQSNEHLWAETYDRAAANLSDVQDEIAARIAATIADEDGAIGRALAEPLMGRPLDSLTIGELVLRFNLHTEQLEHTTHGELIALFEDRVAKEPSHSMGWAVLSVLYGQAIMFGLDHPADAVQRQMQAADRAVSLNSKNQEAWVAVAVKATLARDLALLREATERCVAINPLSGHTNVGCASYLSLAGDYDRALAIYQQCKPLIAQHQDWYYLVPMLHAYHAKQYADALNFAQRIAAPRFAGSAVIAAAAAAQLGREADVRTALDLLRRLKPELLDLDTARLELKAWLWNEDDCNAVIEGYVRALADRSAVRSVDRSEARSDVLSPCLVTVRPLKGSAELADVMATEIATRLAKFNHVRVVPEDLNLKSADRHRYAIEGDVRTSGSASRFNVRLIDLSSGAQLWAQHYDADSSQPAFEVLDNLADRIVVTIADGHGELWRALSQDPALASNLIVRYFGYVRNLSPEEHGALRDAFEAAVAAHPDNADCWARLTVLYTHEVVINFNPRPDSIARALRASERAIAIDPGNQAAWFGHAMACSLTRDTSAFFAASERAIELNPLSSSVVGTLGAFTSYAGETQRGAALVRRAMTLTPHHRPWFFFALFADAFMSGDAEQAFAQAQRTVSPQLPHSKLFTVAAAGRFGRAEAAARSLEEWRQASGNQPFDLDAAAKLLQMSLWPSPFYDAMVDGLRKAASMADERSDVRSDPGREQSIAVLPFTDLSEKKDQDWFCDGIAEEIMSALAPLPGLRVAARASAFSFRGKADDLEAIGEKLNVSTVLEGSVRRSGDRVRITTQLSDAKQGKVLWSERFDRELKDIFDVQEEIARAIADRLRIAVAGGVQRMVAKSTTNIEAYELLLKGRTFLNRRGPAIMNAIECFEKAIAMDPNLADAHAGIGDAYRLLGIYGLMPSREAMTKSRESIERALAIEPDQVEALATLANIKSAVDWLPDEARVLSDRAIALDPGHVRALMESAIALAVTKTEPSSATLNNLILDRMRRARALDPLGAWTMAISAMVLVVMDRAEEAADLGVKALAADPNNFTAHWARVFTLAKLKRRTEARAAAEAALPLFMRHPSLLIELAVLKALDGDQEGAGAIYRELVERSSTQFVGPGSLAIAAMAAGAKDEARRYLAQALAGHDAGISFYKLPAFELLRNDPECAEMFERSALFANRPS